LVKKDFAVPVAFRKNFYPELPGAAGKGGDGRTLLSFALPSPPARRSWPLFLGVARDRQKQRNPAPGERADEV
jgi:hypothetical protein